MDGVVVMGGLFRSADGTIPPDDFVRELGIAERPPVMSKWLTDWSQSCDDMNDSILWDTIVVRALHTA